MPFIWHGEDTELYTGVISAWATCSQYWSGAITLPIKDLLPAGTTGLLIRCQNAAGNYFVGVRPPGSSSTINQWEGPGDMQMAHVGVNADREFQYYKQNAAQKFYLEGYSIGGDVVHFLMPTDKTPAPNVWADINCAAICPGAVAILWEMYRQDGWFWGIRHKGSAQDFRSAVSHHSWGIIGCDASQIFQFYNDDFGGNNAYLFIWGYVTGQATFPTDFEDITPVALGSWEDKDLSAKPNCDIAIVQTYGASFSYGLRTKGSSVNRAGGTPGIHHLPVAPNASGIIQTYRSADAAKFLYLVGWFDSTFVPPFSGGNLADPLVKGVYI